VLQWGKAQNTNSWRFEVVMMPSKGWQRSRGMSSLIEQVIPLHIDFEHIPTKSVHYTLEPSTGLFRTLFWMNLKPYAVIKGIGWLEKTIHPNWELFYCPNPMSRRIQAFIFGNWIPNTIHLSMSLHFTDHQVTAITCHLCERMGSNILYTLIKIYMDAWYNTLLDEYNMVCGML